MYDPGIHIGDIGTIIELVVYDTEGRLQDLSGVSTKQIKFTKPSGATETKTASYSTDGTDGKVRYVMILGDLDESGLWECRAYLAPINGWTGHTSAVQFMVHAV